MNVSEALTKRRTIRKFKNTPIDTNQLVQLIDYARLAPFAANIQALRYKIVNDKKNGDLIFANLKWAGYLKDGSPKPDERPQAYIVVLGDTEIKNNFETDAGAAIQTILLGAWEMGIGSCWIGSLNREEIQKILSIPQKFDILYVIALGYPAEQSTQAPYRGNVKYFYDENNILNVPKLSIDDILL